MLKEYIRIQVLKINRGIEETGIPYYVGYLIAFLIFGFASYAIFRRVPYPAYVYALGLLSVLTKASKSDKNLFLKYTLGNKRFCLLRFIENMLIGFPFALAYVFSGNVWFAVLSLLVSAAWVFINVQIKAIRPLPTPFSAYSFEFMAGFRRNILLIAAMYGCTIYALYSANFQLGIVSFMVLFTVCSTFYSLIEEASLLWINSRSSKDFLKNKVCLALLDSGMMAGPLLLLLLVGFPDKASIIAGIFFLGELFVALVVMAKYWAFPREISLAHGFLVAVAVIVTPISLIIVPFIYRKSLQSLNKLLQ